MGLGNLYHVRIGQPEECSCECLVTGDVINEIPLSRVELAPNSKGGLFCRGCEAPLAGAAGLDPAGRPAGSSPAARQRVASPRSHQPPDVPLGASH
jgi:hypothetical protein